MKSIFPKLAVLISTLILIASSTACLNNPKGVPFARFEYFVDSFSPRPGVKAATITQFAPGFYILDMTVTDFVPAAFANCDEADQIDVDGVAMCAVDRVIGPRSLSVIEVIQLQQFFDSVALIEVTGVASDCTYDPYRIEVVLLQEGYTTTVGTCPATSSIALELGLHSELLQLMDSLAP